MLYWSDIARLLNAIQFVHIFPNILRFRQCINAVLKLCHMYALDCMKTTANSLNPEEFLYNALTNNW